MTASPPSTAAALSSPAVQGRQTSHGIDARRSRQIRRPCRRLTPTYPPRIACKTGVSTYKDRRAISRILTGSCGPVVTPELRLRLRGLLAAFGARRHYDRRLREAGKQPRIGLRVAGETRRHGVRPRSWERQ